MQIILIESSYGLMEHLSLSLSLSLCMFEVYARESITACMHLCTCLNVCMYVCMYVRACVRTYCVCMYVCFFLIWVLRPFQEYFTYIEPIVHQRWAKTGVCMHVCMYICMVYIHAYK